MSIKTISKIGDKCGECGKVRGKHAKPWKTCKDCGKIICLHCITKGFKTSPTNPSCSKCFWKACEEKHKIERNTPVECKICHEKKLPRYFLHCTDNGCKVCNTKIEKEKEKEKKANAIKGLVVVQYGELPKPKRNGGSGYTYYSDEKLKLGDIVKVPQTWLGRGIGRESSTQLATVVSTYSDYDGSVSSIIGIVKRI